MKKFYYIARELAIVKNHLYQIISNPEFYNIGEPALTKLKYVYDKIASLYDSVSRIERG